MNILEKACSKCGEKKPLSEFHKDRSKKDGRVYNCKKCANAIVAAYVAANYEKEKVSNKKRCKKYYAKDRVKNRAKHLERGRARIRRSVADLGDMYVKQAIYGQSGIPIKDIPDPLVQAKRAHLQIVRTLREDKKS